MQTGCCGDSSNRQCHDDRCVLTTSYSPCLAAERDRVLSKFSLKDPVRLPAMPSAVIVSFARTPIGKFRGGLSHLSAPKLASLAIRGALDRVNDGGNDLRIAEAFMGNVLSAGSGQAPCRQAVLSAGLPESTICNTINKVCASGMKAISLAAQSIEASAHDKTFALLAGGMESMSNVPHYLPTSRSGQALGHAKIIDGIIHDGLVGSVDDTCM